jgi:hypothetical protein
MGSVNVDPSALREAAEAATAEAIESEARDAGRFLASVHYERMDRFHALANPAAILSLLAQLEAMRAALAGADEALELLLAWHDEVRRQSPFPSPFGIEAALDDYGTHRPTCAVWRDGHPKCDCGLSAAMEGRT